MPNNTRSILAIIILAFMIRLIGITNAPLERSHNWRQSFTAMVARNFDTTDLIHPKVDLEGGKSVAMEFPVFAYLIHLFNFIFGYTHWHGRIINLVISSVGLFFFFKLIRQLHSENVALFSTVILTFSILFAFSRKIMPDTFSISLVIVGVYFVTTFIYSMKYSYFSLLIGSFFIGIGLLSKIPSVTILAFLAPAFFDTKPTMNVKIKAALKGIIPGLIAALLWYGIVVPSQLENGAIQLYFPVEFSKGFSLINEHISGVLEKFYFSALSSYVLFFIFITGIFFVVVKKDRAITLLFSVSCISFFFFMLKASNYFYFHNYYVIPFVPAMAVVSGFAISEISKKNKIIAILILSVGVSEAVLNQQHDFFIPQQEMYKANLSEIVKTNIPYNEKIILNTGPNPQELYLSNRKGWVLEEPTYIDHTLIENTTKEKAFIIIDRHKETKYNDKDFTIVFQNLDFTILEMKIN